MKSFCFIVGLFLWNVNNVEGQVLSNKLLGDTILIKSTDELSLDTKNKGLSQITHKGSTIIVSGKVQYQGEKSINLIACKSIELGPGFSWAPGSVFVAITGKDSCEEMSGSTLATKNNTFSKQTALQGINTAGIFLTPNPNNGFFKISLPQGAAFSLFIRDLWGRPIKSLFSNGGVLIGDIRPCVPGVYFIEIVSSEGSFKTTLKSVCF